jgi:hypothetical protein
MDIDVIWGKREAEYFCKWDWTGQITLIRFNKLGFPRHRSGSMAREQAAPDADLG